MDAPSNQVTPKFHLEITLFEIIVFEINSGLRHLIIKFRKPPLLPTLLKIIPTT